MVTRAISAVEYPSTKGKGRDRLGENRLKRQEQKQRGRCKARGRGKDGAKADKHLSRGGTGMDQSGKQNSRNSSGKIEKTGVALRERCPMGWNSRNTKLLRD